MTKEKKLVVLRVMVQRKRPESAHLCVRVLRGLRGETHEWLDCENVLRSLEDGDYETAYEKLGRVSWES